MKEGKGVECKEQLVRMGFPPSVISKYQLYELLAPTGFQLEYSQPKGKDVLKAIVYFERKDGICRCTHYEVTVRKKMDVPGIVVGEISLLALKSKMEGLDWHNIAGQLQFEGLDGGGSSLDVEIEGVLSQLKVLEANPEGECWANLLKGAAWIDTPLEQFIPRLHALKSEWEISQRFYYSEEEILITLEEAFRFLYYKLRGKRHPPKKAYSEQMRK